MRIVSIACNFLYMKQSNTQMVRKISEFLASTIHKINKAVMLNKEA